MPSIPTSSEPIATKYISTFSGFSFGILSAKDRRTVVPEPLSFAPLGHRCV